MGIKFAVRTDDGAPSSRRSLVIGTLCNTFLVGVWLLIIGSCTGAFYKGFFTYLLCEAVLAVVILLGRLLVSEPETSDAPSSLA